jgi:FAD/FMN-containing dehydrogenase/uncharacterized membrane protein YhaH (DUF805 family)/SAM-dependent methyltransferase
LRDKLPVSYLLFTPNGRINRRTFWNAQLFIWLSFYVLYNTLDLFINYSVTLVIYPFLYWALYCTATKRLHDRNINSWILLLTLVPIIGPLWLFIQLGLRKGNSERNKYGLPQGHKDDYFVNPNPTKIPHLDTNQRIVNDITHLNPIVVASVIRPTTIQELQELIQSSKSPISVGGGRFSMGGQTASTETLHIDTRSLNKIEAFDVVNKTITIQSGTRWCDIQNYIDKYNLSIKIMQSYANFTVGGSVSVNAHGRYVGLGPVSLSVLEIDLLLADGTIESVSPLKNNELFCGTIGGYNALGIIVRVTLELTENVRIKRISKTMKSSDFRHFFSQSIQTDSKAVMHNTDIYPPDYKTVRAATWLETTQKETTKTRLVPLKGAYPIERYFLWAFSESSIGKKLRKRIIDPIIYSRKKIHWRNYEAGYDVAELEPKSRTERTYVLREYFIPVEKFDEFTAVMREIFVRHRVNIINISIRHSIKDDRSYLAWSNKETFAFVVYYKQRTRENAKSRVAVWTREMNEAAINMGGTFYLPYQILATKEQFHRAYPRAKDLFILKDKYDPEYRFRNKLWDTYYKPKVETMKEFNSEFKTVMTNTEWSDQMYRFLQVIFHLYPEDRFHQLIKDAVVTFNTDEEIYKDVQSKLSGIKPFLSEFTYALPALKKQKREMSNQVQKVLESTSIHGYLEIGSTGRYVSELRKHIKIDGPIYLQNDIAPGNGIGDLFERGQLKKIGTFIHLDYTPIDEKSIPSNSLDVVTCFIGLHHCPEEKLKNYVASIYRVLKPNGKFIVRDHDCNSPEMTTFASLVHTVFNLGLKESWEFNQKEYRSFRSAQNWSEYLENNGFKDTGHRILQENDPSLNTLMCFSKV